MDYQPESREPDPRKALGLEPVSELSIRRIRCGGGWLQRFRFRRRRHESQRIRGWRFACSFPERLAHPSLAERERSRRTALQKRHPAVRYQREVLNVFPIVLVLGAPSEAWLFSLN